MITSVSIENFRGVREGTIEGLAPISVLVGPNNTGKSTVLEAIMALGGAADASDLARILLRRGGPAHDALARIVSAGAKEASIKGVVDEGGRSKNWRVVVDLPQSLLLARIDDARMQGLKEPLIPFRASTTHGAFSFETVSYIDPKGQRSRPYKESGQAIEGQPPWRFVDVEAVRGDGALEDAYTRIDEARRLPIVLKALARSLPGLKDLRILKVGQDFVLHTFFESGAPVPAYVAGDGFKRFLEVAAATVSAPRGVVLLEEPESFQHPRYLHELAMLFHLAAHDGTQIILSTHSLELIDLLVRAPEAEGQTYPAVFRCTFHEGKLRATKLDRDQALDAREGLYTDLRA